jgi:hypothetical protein
MATVTPPPVQVTDANRDDVHRRVRHPLDRMRGTIRGYVSGEGFAVLVIYLALWFWITLALDYGLFQARAIDLTDADSMPNRALRGLLLGGLFAFVLALVGLFRASGSATRDSGQSTRRPTWLTIVLLVGMVLLLAAPLVFFVLQGQAPIVAGIMLGFHLLVMTTVLVIAVLRILHSDHSALWLGVAAALGLVYVGLWCFVGLVRQANLTGGTGTAVLLGMLAAAPVVWVVTRMLTTTFSAPSLALVLERRFPKVLGDRLITAVELADPKVAAKYGYSQAMIDRTTSEAAECMATLPVNEVFDWKRLMRYGLFVLGLTVGMILLGFVGFWGDREVEAMSAQASLTRLANAKNDPAAQADLPAARERVARAEAVRNRPAVSDFAAHSWNLGSLWFERNVLLSNTPWPRQAKLELVGFRDEWVDRGMPVPRSAASAPVRVRAIKWIVADNKAVDGWRALRWSELTPKLLGARTVIPTLPVVGTEQRPALAGAQIAGLAADRGLSALAGAPSLEGWTVDQVEAELNKPTVLKIDDVTADQAREVLKVLGDVADRPDMQRHLRKLEIPDKVMVFYSGDQTSSEITLKREGSNEFVGVLANLPETVSFQANAKDYFTPKRKVLVVPPPSIIDLERSDSLPAYLYLRPYKTADRRATDLGNPELLKGKRLTPPPEKVALSSTGSVIDVPSGATVKLTATAGWTENKDRRVVSEEKKLKAVRIIPRRGIGLPDTAKLVDNKTFELTLTDVTSRLEFDFEMQDEYDNVTGRYSISINPEQDRAPDVNVQVESMIRKVAGGTYMVTSSARVPFVGEVTDDHGLHTLDWNFTLTPVDSPDAIGVKVKFAAFAFGITPLSPPPAAHLVSRLITTEPEARSERTSLSTFQAYMTKRAGADVSEEEFQKLLLKKPSLLPPLLTKFKLYPAGGADEVEAFDVAGLDVRTRFKDANDLTRYRLRVWVVATDSNVESKNGPGIGESKERFTFLIVPEAELLAEVDKDEERLRQKFEKARIQVRDTRNEKFSLAISELQDSKEIARIQGNAEERDKFYSALATRIFGIGEQISSAELAVKEVASDYDRLHKELVVNLRQKLTKEGRPVHPMISHLDDILTGLDKVRSGNGGEFPAALDALQALQKGLELKQNDPANIAIAQKKLDDLVARLEDLSRLLGELQNFQKTVQEAWRLKTDQLKENELLKMEKDRLEKELIDRILNPK